MPAEITREIVQAHADLIRAADALRALLTPLADRLGEVEGDYAKLAATLEDARRRLSDTSATLATAQAERDALVLENGRKTILLRAADDVMKAIDTEVRAGRLATRTRITDAREDYSDPYKYAATEQVEIAALRALVATQGEALGKIKVVTDGPWSMETCPNLLQSIALILLDDALALTSAVEKK